MLLLLLLVLQLLLPFLLLLILDRVPADHEGETTFSRAKAQLSVEAVFVIPNERFGTI